MKTCLVLISDGREDYLEQTLASAREMLPDCDEFVHIDDRDHKFGFSGAIQQGWRQALATGADYTVHLEQDFTFRRPVPLHAMIDTLHARPYLVQMALLRQPWNESERAVGGVIQQHPDDYTRVEHDGHTWLEHRRHVTTNPCVWPRWVMELGWPDGPQSEGHFGIRLFASNPSLRAAYWDGGDVWVDHIGTERAGVGY